MYCCYFTYMSPIYAVCMVLNLILGEFLRDILKFKHIVSSYFSVLHNILY